MNRWGQFAPDLFTRRKAWRCREVSDGRRLIWNIYDAPITPFGSCAWTMDPSISRGHLIQRKTFSSKRVIERYYARMAPSDTTRKL